VGENLKYLDLDNNFIVISNEGSEFRGIEDLRTLELSGNSITHLKRNMFQYVAQHLRTLYLESNLISEIDSDTFLDFRNLKTLSLRDNIISEISTDMFQGLENDLITLNLAENTLRRLESNSFSRLVKLEQLELYHNRLLNTTSPKAFDGLTNLLQLWMSDSVVTRLDGMFDCENGVSPMPNAKSILLSGGLLTEIGAHAFKNVSSISSLYLNGNKIHTLHEDTFYDLTSLKVLDLSENALESIPVNMFLNTPDIQGLALNDNMLEDIPEAIFAGLNQIHLKQLQLENNDITTIDKNTFDTFIDCTKTTWTMYNNPSVCSCVNNNKICECAPYLSSDSNGCKRITSLGIHATCLTSGCTEHSHHKKTFQNCENIESVSGDLHFSTEGGDLITISGLPQELPSTFMNSSSWKLTTSATAARQSVVTSCFTSGRNVSCEVPAGTGKYNSLVLSLENKDTEILSGCTFDYAEPEIDVFAGCFRCRDDMGRDDCEDEPESRDAKRVTTVDCDRMGGSRIALYGKNFGFEDALVFVNGVSCADVQHAPVNQSICAMSYDTRSEALSIKPLCENCTSGPIYREGKWYPCTEIEHDVSPHTMLTCVLPSLQFSQARANSVSIVQSNLFGLSHGLFRYHECDPGERQYSNQTNHVTAFVGCETCDAGLFSSLEDETYCHSCEPGSYSIKGASECMGCPKNTMSAPPNQVNPNKYITESGSSACLECPTGKSAQRGSDRCTVCGFIHLGSTHCGSPVMAIILGVLLLVVGCGCVYRTYLRSQGEVLRIKKTLDMKSLDMQLMRAAWNIDWDQIDLEKEPIASGSYGAVYRGILSGKFEIAVKLFYKMPGDEDDEDDEEETNDEIRFLQRARHPRLTHFLGSGKTTDENRYLFVVMEYMEEVRLSSRSSVSFHLHNHSTTNQTQPTTQGTLSDRLWIKETLGGITTIPTWVQRIIWMTDVASGLTYLHLIHKSIHRDLKSPNVLLTKENGELRAKVADFGLTKILSPEVAFRVHHEEKEELENGDNVSGIMTSGEGTVQWMAPEIIENMSDSKALFTQAVDVFAFGIMLWEAIFLKAPWSEIKWQSKICEKVVEGKRPTISTSGLAKAPDLVVELMFRCWAQRPQDRPIMSECLDILQTAGIEIQDEPKPIEKKRHGNHNRNVSAPEMLIEARDVFKRQFRTMLGKITGEEESKEENNMSIPLVDVKSNNGDNDLDVSDCLYESL